MPEPIRSARTTAAYSSCARSYYRPQQDSCNSQADTVQISSEAYEKSKEYMAQLNKGPSPEQPPPTQQAENATEIFNLPPDATRDQIRKAYLGAIKLYHPDNFAGLGPEFSKLAEEKSKQINLVYRKLTSANSANSRQY